MQRALNMRNFRESVEAIDNDMHRTLIMAMYLLAARESEIATKTDSERMRRGIKPYGNFLRYQIEEYKEGELNEKALLITSAVAKRTKINKEALKKAVVTKDPKIIENALRRFGLYDTLARWKKGELELTEKFIAQITGKLFFKTVGVPIDPKYEPWSLEILKYIKREGLLKFYLGDRNIRVIVSKYLKPQLGYDFTAHKIRHIRITHLVQYYNFDPYEVSSYAGWSFRTVFAGMGMNISPMLDVYAHLVWRRYFPKLLVPIDDLLHK